MVALLEYPHRYMRLLTRTEEYILLTVWRLQKEAYSIRIRSTLNEMMAKPWSMGGVYMPLERLEKRGLLTSTTESGGSARGGRPRRVYELTADGQRALAHVKSVDQAMWSGLQQLTVEIS